MSTTKEKRSPKRSPKRSLDMDELKKTKNLLLQTQQALLYALDEGCGAWERAEIKEKWPQAYDEACKAEDQK